jgi:phosphatidylserine synthase
VYDGAAWGLVVAQFGITIATITGPVTIGLPVPAAASAVVLTVPVGLATANANAQVAIGSPFLATANTLQIRAGDTGVWDTLRPFGWAVGNTIGLTATYEAA